MMGIEPTTWPKHAKAGVYTAPQQELSTAHSQYGHQGTYQFSRPFLSSNPSLKSSVVFSHSSLIISV